MGIGGEAADECGKDDSKGTAVALKKDKKVGEKANVMEDKGKTKTKAKMKSTAANEKSTIASEKSPVTNERSGVKDKKRGINDPKVDEDGKASSGTKGPDANVKHGRSKDRGENKVKDEKGKVRGGQSKAKDGNCNDTDEKSQEKGKKKKEELTMKRRGKGKSSTKVVSSTTELSVSQSPPSVVGSASPRMSEGVAQSSSADPSPSTQRTSGPHVHTAGASNPATYARTVESLGDGGDTDVEESDSSYYTVGA